MDRIRETVLDLLANELFQAGRRIQENVDWEQVFQECRRQTVTVHGWNQVCNMDFLPEAVRKDWGQAAVGDAFHNLQVSWEHGALGGSMEKAGIPYVILKGCASAAYYPRPEDRIMGDVDLLVRPEDLDRAGRVLEGDGFQLENDTHVPHRAYVRERTEAELHFAVGGIPWGEPGKRVRGSLEGILEESREIPVEGGGVRVPSHFHHGLNLLLHTNQHLLGEGLGLRHLCDWAVFAAGFSDEEFRELFEEKLKAVGLWRFARTLTQTAVRYLGCPPKAWAGEPDRRITEAFMEEIGDSGNFGRKQEGRFYESLLIASQEKRMVSRKSMGGQLIRSMNEMVRRRWPAAGRFPLLLPPGWIFLGGRYLIRVARGKRPSVHPGQILRQAGERKRRYRALGLFETEEQRP